MRIVCLVCLFIFFTVFVFFLGRAYEFFANKKRMYSGNWLRYQSALLRGCMQENRENGGGVLDSFFVNNGYKRIVIYAVGGIYYNSFIESINLEQFDMVYLADANHIQLQKQFGEKVYAKEELPELLFDIIVVTSVAHFYEISRELRKLGISKNIVSYSDLVFNAARED